MLESSATDALVTIVDNNNVLVTTNKLLHTHRDVGTSFAACVDQRRASPVLARRLVGRRAFLSSSGDAKPSRMADALVTIKLYYDYKSPFTYLAMHPAYALMESHRVLLPYIPHELDVRGSFGGELDQRSERDWRKVRYQYLDARRYANARGMIVRGPQKIFDSKLSLRSGLFADKHGLFPP